MQFIRKTQRVFQEDWNEDKTEISLFKKDKYWKAKLNKDGSIDVETGKIGGKNVKKTQLAAKKKDAHNAGKKAQLKGLDYMMKNRGYVMKDPQDQDWTPLNQIKVEPKVAGIPPIKTPMPSVKETPPHPMLAATFDKKAGALPKDFFVQPKLDGVRGVISTKTGRIYSRQGNELFLPHLSDIVRSMEITEVDWLDGELYNHGVGFQSIVGVVKRQDGNDKAKLKISYWWYDVISSAPFSKRTKIIEKIYNSNKSKIQPHTAIVMVPTYEAKSRDDLQVYHEQFLKHQFEGSMIRYPDKPYEAGKRSKWLLKFKDWKDSEYKVVGFKPEIEGSSGKAKETLGAIICETDKGQKFAARPAMTAKERQEIWDNQAKYLKMVATIKYFELSDTGIPRFPVAQGFRLEQ